MPEGVPTAAAALLEDSAAAAAAALRGAFRVAVAAEGTAAGEAGMLVMAEAEAVLS
ncbi:MAG TPA: hypothetical protein VHR45_18875 [Thermoanaerobaculia bacterium]|nr:hypothetical protein [Thermoanaerobaculia bacterium]